MTSTRSNLAISANVMLTVDPSSGRPFSERDTLAFLPGDFLVKVQSVVWKDIGYTLQHMTPLQRAEYRQNLVCRLCRRRCAGTCDLGGGGSSEMAHP